MRVRVEVDVEFTTFRDKSRRVGWGQTTMDFDQVEALISGRWRQGLGGREEVGLEERHREPR